MTESVKLYCIKKIKIAMEIKQLIFYQFDYITEYCIPYINSICEI